MARRTRTKKVIYALLPVVGSCAWSTSVAAITLPPNRGSPRAQIVRFPHGGAGREPRHLNLGDRLRKRKGFAGRSIEGSPGSPLSPNVRPKNSRSGNRAWDNKPGPIVKEGKKHDSRERTTKPATTGGGNSGIARRDAAGRTTGNGSTGSGGSVRVHQRPRPQNVQIRTPIPPRILPFLRPHFLFGNKEEKVIEQISNFGGKNQQKGTVTVRPPAKRAEFNFSPEIFAEPSDGSVVKKRKIFGFIDAPGSVELPPFHALFAGGGTQSDRSGVFAFDAYADAFGGKKPSSVRIVIVKSLEPRVDSNGLISGYKVPAGMRRIVALCRRAAEQDLELTRRKFELELRNLRSRISDKEGQLSVLREAMRELGSLRGHRERKKAMEEGEKRVKRLVREAMALRMELGRAEEKLREVKAAQAEMRKARVNGRRFSFWIVEEKEGQEELPLLASDIIILMHPKLVDRIVPWNFRDDGEHLFLPRILLKREITFENRPHSHSVTRGSIKSGISATVLAAIHERKAYKTIHGDGNDENLPLIIKN